MLDGSTPSLLVELKALYDFNVLNGADAARYVQLVQADLVKASRLSGPPTEVLALLLSTCVLNLGTGVPPGVIKYEHRIRAESGKRPPTQARDRAVELLGALGLTIAIGDFPRGRALGCEVEVTWYLSSLAADRPPRWLTDELLDPTIARERLVVPFYLKMMGTNAVEHGNALEQELVAVGREASSKEVIRLLRDPWRSTVMGAWLALLHDDDAVTAEVLRSLSRSGGSLDSPPLVTAAVVLRGRPAIAALHEYAVRDVAAELGAGGFVGAALEHLGEHPKFGTTEVDRADFAALLALALRLRAGSDPPLGPRRTQRPHRLAQRARRESNPQPSDP